MKEEYEIVEHSQIEDMNVFLVEMTYRLPHMHREFEICMVLSGEVDIYTGRDTYRFRRGEMMILNPRQTHEIHALTENSLILSFQAASGLFNRIYPDIKNLWFEDVRIEDFDGGLFKSRLLELSLAYLRKDAGYEFFCMADFAWVFGSLLVNSRWHLISEKERVDNATKSERLRRLLDYIEENFSGKLLLSDLAESEGVSMYYLSHFFKEMLGMPFQDYLAVTRFEKARRLVEHTDMSLTEISLECGFSDYRYLNKIYQKQLGYTPKDYRKSHEASGTDISSKGADPFNTQRFCTEQESIEIIEIAFEKYKVPRQDALQK